MQDLAASTLPGLVAIAFALGMRHGIDADHLAAIDTMTRLNMPSDPRLARRTGLWFAFGHGAVVMAFALGVAALAPAWAAPRWLGPVGAWSSIAMLAVLGALNLSTWQPASPSTAGPAAWRTRLYAQALNACRRRAVAGVGALFALSFDTLGQAALLGASGMARRGVGGVALLAGAFVLGMALTDGLNGWWVARLLRRTGARAAQASRATGAVVGAVSLATAALGAAAEMSAPVASWCARHGGLVAALVVAAVGASLLAGLAGTRDRADARALPEPAA